MNNRATKSLVLFLPQASRYQQFVKLILGFQRTFSTVTIDAKASFRNYRDASDFFIPFPNWTKELPTQSEIERATSYLSKIEKSVQFSTSRIILAGERTIGAGFGADQYAWPSSGFRRKILSDNNLPYKVISTMFLWAMGIIDRFQPKLMVLGSSSSPINLIFSLIAEDHKIPFFILRPSKILSNRFYCTQDRMMLNDRVIERYRELNLNDESAFQNGAVYISKFRQSPDHVQYIKKNWQIAEHIGIFEQHRRFAVMGLMAISARLKRSNTLPPKPFLSTILSYYQRAVRKQTQTKYYSKITLSNLQATKYIYFPLHKEPELALNLQAYSWHNQTNTVARLSAVLPAGFRLLVKEHRLNYGRRPSQFLRKLASLPGVTIIDPYEGSFPYLQQADLIVTENGASGWEGLVFNKPVLCLDRTFYDPLGLANNLRDFTDFNEAILASIFNYPKNEGHDRRIKCFVEAELATTISEDSPNWADRTIGELLHRCS